MIGKLIVAAALLLLLPSIVHSGAPGQARRHLVPTIYIFGDSLVDVGNNNHLPGGLDTKANYRHYGIDYPVYAKVSKIQYDGTHHTTGGEGRWYYAALPNADLFKLFHLGDQDGSIHGGPGVWDAIELAAGVVVERRKDKMALACIFQAVPEDVLLQIVKKDTAKEAWQSLKTRYLGADQVKKARVQTLKIEFEALRTKETVN